MGEYWHDSSVPIVGYSFYTLWDEQMHVKSLFIELNFDTIRLGLELGTL